MTEETYWSRSLGAKGTVSSRVSKNLGGSTWPTRALSLERIVPRASTFSGTYRKGGRRELGLVAGRA